MDLRRFFSYSVVALGAMVFSVGIQAYAFTQPSTSPPNADAYAPLNTGSSAQAKVGGLLLNTGNATNGLIVQYGNVGIGTASPGAKLDVSGQLIGGFGAMTTGGVANWNDVSNVRSGNGYTLLMGNAANGPGPSYYFHTLNFEYGSKNGAGNVTQLAIPYGSPGGGGDIYMRGRYSGTWSSWSKVGNSGTVGGSGTASYLPKWTAASTLGNSLLYDNGTNVGIGTASPGQKLDVTGNIRASGMIYNYGTPAYANGMSTYVLNTNYLYPSGNGTSDMYVGITGTRVLFRGSMCLNGSCLTSWPSPNGGTASAITNDSYNMKFHWSGQSGQPTWLWGSNNGTDSYVWNPSNFSVSYANSAGSAAYATSAGSATNATNAIGYGQTWQNVTGSRVIGTTYTNSTSKPIMVSVTGTCGSTGGAGEYLRLYVGSILVGGWYASLSGNAIGGSASTIVPAGNTYRTVRSGANCTVTAWSELR